MKQDRVYLNIYPERIRRNMMRISERLPEGVMRCLCIKADAYGLGAGLVGQAVEHAVDFFAVAAASEAMQLINRGITKPILVLGYVPHEDYAELITHHVRLAVYRKEDAVLLSRIATELGTSVKVHFKVDTGMNRLGFEPDESGADLVAECAAMPGIVSEGLFSHFARADEADLTATRVQYGRYKAFREMLCERGVKISIYHISNSAAAMVFPEAVENMIRLGIAAYGYYPSTEMAHTVELLPAVEMKSTVSMVKILHAGEEVSYGGRYTADSERILATVPVGYADGYTRLLSGKAEVLIRGKRVPVRGNICMDQMMADVTDVPGVKVGDTVTLLGRDGDEEITLDELSERSGVLNYELLCGLSHWRTARNMITED